MSKTLFIITTRKTPHEKASKDSFFSSSIEPIKYKTKFLSFYFNENFYPGWYIVEGKNGFAFGHPIHPSVQQQDNQYLNALCLEVKDHFTDEQVNEISEVILLLHAPELGVQDGFRRQSNLERLVKRSWANSTLQTVKVIAFKHNPEYAFYSFLKNTKVRFEYDFASDLIDQLKYTVDRSLDILPLTNEEQNSARELFSQELKSLVHETLSHFSMEVFKPIMLDGIPKIGKHELKKNNEPEIKASIEDFNHSCFGQIDQFLLNFRSKTQNPLKIILLPICFLEDNRLKSLLEEFYDTGIKEKKQERLDVPVLFIGYYDLMYENINYSQDIDKGFRFLDSSIWRRYAPLNDGGKKLLQALRSIKWSYQRNLYKKNVSKEYHEFTWRLFKESYLNKDQGDRHSSYVKPFIFHSESAMETKAVELAKQLRDKKLQWSILYIDDYCNSSLREGKNIPTPSENQPTKGALVKEIIEKGLDSENPEWQLIEEQSYVLKDNVREAITSLSDPNNMVYDLILLDYLFSRERDEDEVSYGTELLTYLNRPLAGHQFNFGLLQAFWIFPTTTFLEAMQSDILGNSIQNIEKNWYLAHGADPINTPHLFRYHLFEFMRLQLNKVYFTIDDIFSFLKENPVASNPNLKDWARKTYRQFMVRFAGVYAVNEQSSFGRAVTHFLNSSENKDVYKVREIVENFMSLFYQLAFTTGNDNMRFAKEKFQVIKEYYNNFSKYGDKQLDKAMMVFETRLSEAFDQYFISKEDTNKIRRMLSKAASCIEKDDLQGALDILTIFQSNELLDKSSANELQMYKGRLKRVKKDYRVEFITYEQFNSEKSKLSRNLLEFFDELEEDLIKKP